MVRPFWPGGDFERFDYPDGCCVVDNPPFSIITKITRFYLDRNIRFFLFAPTLTLFGGVDVDACYIPVGVTVTYENGAKVNTSFMTNLDTCRVRTAPALYRAVVADETRQKALHKQLPKYSYPDCIITSAMVARWCKYGIEYRLNKEECVQISALDSQRAVKKAIFGRGYLLSDRAAAERAAAHRWEISGREQEMIDALNATQP